jgi:hypothetical protein
LTPQRVAQCVSKIRIFSSIFKNLAQNSEVVGLASGLQLDCCFVLDKKITFFPIGTPDRYIPTYLCMYKNGVSQNGMPQNDGQLQSDQIGHILAYWTIANLGQFSKEAWLIFSIVKFVY